MRFVRYTAATDYSMSGDNKVCQIQYGEDFIHLIDTLKTAEGCFVELHGNTMAMARFGDILHDDRAQGEFYEIDGDDILDGLPDESSFSEDESIKFSHLEVNNKWITIFGKTEDDEVSAEISINHLKPFIHGR